MTNSEPHLLTDDFLRACQARCAWRLDASGRPREAVGEPQPVDAASLGTRLSDLDRAVPGALRGHLELSGDLGLAWESTPAGERLIVLFDTRTSLAVVRSRLRALCRSAASSVQS